MELPDRQLKIIAAVNTVFNKPDMKGREGQCAILSRWISEAVWELEEADPLMILGLVAEMDRFEREIALDAEPLL